MKSRTYLLGCGMVFVAAALLVAGCGSGEYSSVEGTVTLDSTPLPDATVVFQSPNMPLATAKTNDDGRYSVETGSIQGIKPGEYVVTVAAYQRKKGSDERAPILSIPRRYLQADSSGLKATIIDGANRSIDFDLKTDRPVADGSR